MRRTMIAVAIAATAAGTADDQVYAPGVISTAAAEVRLAFSPDDKRVLWGAIGREGSAEAQDIWEARRTPVGWSTPRRVSFDTGAVEFDPAFSPDGRRLYFHSDRPGGFGGTDLYVVDVDQATGGYSVPRNLGPAINSKGDEWAPTPTRDGRLIFASDGWGGFGSHDLFEARLGDPAGRPANLGAGVNGGDRDFDAALTPDGRALIFSSGTMTDTEADVRLYRSDRTVDGRWGPRRPISAGCSSFAIGSSFDPRDREHFYYAARCDDGLGRMDIRRVPIAAIAPSPSL